MNSEKIKSVSPGWLPSLKSVRALETVARLGSFQQAAEELGVSPAAVHQLVRGLEDVLGQNLVRRNGRHIAITNATEAGLAELHVAFKSLASGVRKIREYDGRRQLRISVDPSFAHAWLVGRLSRFQDKNPNVDVLIDSTTRFADLVQGHADIAIRYTADIGDEVQSFRLFEDETIAVCSPALIKQKHVPLDLDVLAETPLLHFDWLQSPQIQVNWQRWIALVDGPEIEVRGGARFTDYNAVVQAAIAGQGMALVGRPLVTEALAMGILVEPFGRGYQNGYAYYALTARSVDEANDDEVAEFVSWLTNESAHDSL